MACDVCVIGLGGIGSAVAEHCARRGARVVGLEQFSRGHDLGSSTGRTRMIRRAYFEDPAYVPLVRRAYDLWSALEKDSGEELLAVTGVLAVGKETSEVIAGVRRAAREHEIETRSLTAGEVVTRYPMVRLQADEIGILEPGGGVLNPERAIAAQLSMAEARGAELRFNAGMTQWQWRNGCFEITLDDLSKITADCLVLAVGPWIEKEIAPLDLRIEIERNVQIWFETAKDSYTPDKMPAFLLDREGLPAPLYGFPNFGDGVKAAFHGSGDLTDAENVDREVNQDRDIAPVARALEDWMPGAARKQLAAKVCLYSLTSDRNFIIDRHPDYDRLILCGGFSGHGFKFAPVVGEIATDLVLDGATRHPIDFLSLRRFARSEA